MSKRSFEDVGQDRWKCQDCNVVISGAEHLPRHRRTKSCIKAQYAAAASDQARVQAEWLQRLGVQQNDPSPQPGGAAHDQILGLLQATGAQGVGQGHSAQHVSRLGDAAHVDPALDAQPLVDPLTLADTDTTTADGGAGGLDRSLSPAPPSPGGAISQDSGEEAQGRDASPQAQDEEHGGGAAAGRHDHPGGHGWEDVDRASATPTLSTASEVSSEDDPFVDLDATRGVVDAQEAVDSVRSRLSEIMRLRGGLTLDEAYHLLEDTVDDPASSALEPSVAKIAIEQTELLYAVLAQLGEDEALASSNKPAARGTLRWYRENKHSPIAPGSSLTIFQAAYGFLRLKLDGKLPEKQFARLLSFTTGRKDGQACGVLPVDNNMPRSEHFLRGIIGVLSAQSVAIDMCPRPSCARCFGKALPPQERRDHQGQRCLDCGAPRFSKVNEVLTPMRSGYLISPWDILRHKMLDPVFAQFAGTRTRAFLDSPLFKALDHARGGALSRAVPAAFKLACQSADAGDTAAAAADEVYCGDVEELVLMCALFVDGVQMHELSDDTTTAFSWKCLDLPAHIVQTQLASYNIAFIGGEKEPTNLTSFLTELLSQVADGPLEVVDVPQEGQNTPARRSWAMTCGHSGRSGCDKCGIQGSVRQGDTHVTWGGYLEPAPTKTFDLKGVWSEGEVLYDRSDGDIGDCAFAVESAAALLINDEKHRMRAERAQTEGRRLAQKHPLPAAATNGGSLHADPASRAERALTKECNKRYERWYKAANEYWKAIGCRGYSAFMLHCRSCRFERMYVEGLSHTIWNGIGRPALTLVTDPNNGIEVDGKPFCFSRKLMERCDNLTKTLRKHGSYNRPFPLFKGGKSVKSWLFEEMRAFTDIVGPALFSHFGERDGVPPLFLRMWGHFRHYALYFTRYRPGQHTEPQVRAAQNHLLSYAQLAEAHLGGKLLTLLLHRGVVHIPEQALENGPSAWQDESWGERDIRRPKQFVTNHASRDPAKYATNVCLTDLGLELCKVELPDIAAHVTLPQAEHAPGTLDDTDSDGVCLIGRLKDANERRDGDQVSTFARTLEAMHHSQERGRHRVDDASAIAGRLREQHVLTQHRQGVAYCAATTHAADTASIGHGAALVRTIAGSRAYGRTQCEHFAFVPFVRANGALNACVLEIEQLLLVRCPGMGWPDDTARLATGTLYDVAEVVDGPGHCTVYNDDPRLGACTVPTMLRVPSSSKGYKWAVHLRQIDCPLVCLERQSGTRAFFTFHKMGFGG